jgi:hypothetical protein
MASEAEFSAFCEKELHRLGIFFMGFRVAGDASACVDNGMDHLAGHLHLMALRAVRVFLGRQCLGEHKTCQEEQNAGEKIEQVLS